MKTLLKLALLLLATVTIYTASHTTIKSESHLVFKDGMTVVGHTGDDYTRVEFAEITSSQSTVNIVGATTFDDRIVRNDQSEMIITLNNEVLFKGWNGDTIDTSKIYHMQDTDKLVVTINTVSTGINDGSEDLHDRRLDTVVLSVDGDTKSFMARVKYYAMQPAWMSFAIAHFSN